MNTKAASERYQRQVQELSKQPGNAQCADCGGRYPRWASWNLGIFLCVNCAGVHRKMGTHISKVKSLTLDTWTKEQVERMREMGNVKNNRKFNPDERRNRPPANVQEGERNSELERFIFDKYRGRFMDARPPPVPSKDTLPRLSPNATGSSGSGSSGEASAALRSGPSLSSPRLRSTTTPIPSSWSEAKRAVSPIPPPTPVSPLDQWQRASSPHAEAPRAQAQRTMPSTLAPPLANVPPRSSSATVPTSASGVSTSTANTTASSSVFDDLLLLQQPATAATAAAPSSLQLPPHMSLQQQQSFQTPAHQMNPWAHLATQQQAVVSPMVMSHQSAAAAAVSQSPFFSSPPPSASMAQFGSSAPSYGQYPQQAFASAAYGQNASAASFSPQMIGQQAFGHAVPHIHQQQTGMAPFASPPQPQQQSSMAGNPFGSFASSMMPSSQAAAQPNQFVGGHYVQQPQQNFFHS